MRGSGHPALLFRLSLCAPGGSFLVGKEKGDVGVHPWGPPPPSCLCFPCLSRFPVPSGAFMGWDRARRASSKKKKKKNKDGRGEACCMAVVASASGGMVQKAPWTREPDEILGLRRACVPSPTAGSDAPFSAYATFPPSL